MFSDFLNELELKEQALIGRRYTWSNKRREPGADDGKIRQMVLYCRLGHCASGLSVTGTLYLHVRSLSHNDVDERLVPAEISLSLLGALA
jgi:hypothetical protein